MRLTIQKRLAGQMLKCSKKRIRFDPDRLDEVKEAVTKADIRALIKKEAIKRKPVKGISRGRARKIRIQKIKGLRKGHGSRKGKKTARTPKKRKWIETIRAQKNLLKLLRDKGVISKRNYRELYLKSKGGFFRSRRHIKLYITEHNLSSTGSQ